MKFLFLQLFKKKKYDQKFGPQKGFTLVETMVAVFVMSIALGSLFELTANSISSARNSRNEIIATYLSQEVLDVVRNDRDTAIQGNNKNLGQWLMAYGLNPSQPLDKCFNTTNGCQFTVYESLGNPMGIINPRECSSNGCEKISFYDADPTHSDEVPFYGYAPIRNQSVSQKTPFTRKIVMTVDPDQIANPMAVTISVTTSWKSGFKTYGRTLTTILTNWMNEI